MISYSCFARPTPQRHPADEVERFFNVSMNVLYFFSLKFVL